MMENMLSWRYIVFDRVESNFQEDYFSLFNLLQCKHRTFGFKTHKKAISIIRLMWYLQWHSLGHKNSN